MDSDKMPGAAGGRTEGGKVLDPRLVAGVADEARAQKAHFPKEPE